MNPRPPRVEDLGRRLPLAFFFESGILTKNVKEESESQMALLIEIPKMTDLEGRIISLNPQVCTRFQCGGFSVNMTRPIGVVGPGTQQNQIHQGLLDGRLMDITDHNIDGLKTRQGSYTAPKDMGAKGHKVYIQRDKLGNVLIAVPKDAAEEDKFERELEDGGSIHADNYSVEDRQLIGGGTVGSVQADETLSSMANAIDSARTKYYVPKLR